MKIGSAFVWILCLLPALAMPQVKSVDLKPVSVQNVCSSNVDCSCHGACNNGQCICDVGFTTPTDGPSCSYKQKNQLTAFLLHLFLGAFVGAGEIYVGNNSSGVGQLILGASAASLSVYGCLRGVTCENTPKVGIAVASSILLADVAWWIADCVRFGKNEVRDGSGYPLRSW